MLNNGRKLIPWKWQIGGDQRRKLPLRSEIHRMSLAGSLELIRTTV